MLALLIMPIGVLSHCKLVHPDGRFEEGEFNCDSVAAGVEVT